MPVSIITPVLNQLAYIETAIRSVMVQEYVSIQHIVIDGGSIDGTLDILLRYPHLKWISEPDGGQTHAINKGLRMARGDILTWLNSDDLLLPGTIEAVVKCFQEHPEAGFVYGDCQIIDETGCTIFERKVVDYDWGILVYGRSLVNQPASFFRRSVIEEIGLLDEQFNFCMDLEFWVRAAYRGIKFQTLPIPLACFRLHSSAKTARLCREMFAEHRKILEMYSSLPWKSLGPLAGKVQFLMNVYHHTRDIIFRMRQRRDFGVLRGYRAQKLMPLKPNPIGLGTKFRR